MLLIIKLSILIWSQAICTVHIIIKHYILTGCTIKYRASISHAPVPGLSWLLRTISDPIVARYHSRAKKTHTIKVRLNLTEENLFSEFSLCVTVFRNSVATFRISRLKRHWSGSEATLQSRINVTSILLLGLFLIKSMFFVVVIYGICLLLYMLDLV